MYKSKYPSLINFLTNQEDLILLDSEIQNIENLIDKDIEEQLILSGVVSALCWHSNCKNIKMDAHFACEKHYKEAMSKT